MTELKECPTCNGTGILRDTTCHRCSGSGYQGTIYHDRRGHLMPLNIYLDAVKQLTRDFEEMAGDRDYIHISEAYQWACDNPPTRDI